MKLIKRLAVFGAAAVMAVSALPLNVSAADTEEKVRVYRMNSGLGYVYYSDDYFASPGTEENEHLRTLSLAFAASVAETEEGEGGIYDLYKGAGFDMECLESENMESNDTVDAIGTFISHKQTEYGPVIAVSVRGVDYGAEWANNFTIGKAGDAEGFSQSSLKVVERIRAYEEKYDLNGAKIWINGFSRGAAVADMTGKFLNEHHAEFGIEKEDIYVYCYAVPRSSKRETKYENIHDYIDPNDLIPKLPPEQWGFNYTGTVTVLMCTDGWMQEKEFSLFGDDKIKDKDDEKIRAQDFEKDLLEKLTEVITREQFDGLRDDFNAVFPMFVGDNADPNALLFVNTLAEGMELNLSNPLLPFIIDFLRTDPGTDDYDKLFDEDLPPILDKLIEESGADGILEEEKEEKLKAAFVNVIKILLPVIKDDLLGDNYLVANLFGNIEEIIGHHRTEHYFELLIAEDSYYTGTLNIKPGTVNWFGEIIEDADEARLKELGLFSSDIKRIQDGYSLTVGFLPEKADGIQQTDLDAVRSLTGSDNSKLAPYSLKARKLFETDTDSTAAAISSKTLWSFELESSELDASEGDEIAFYHVQNGKAEAVSAEIDRSQSGVIKISAQVDTTSGYYVAAAIPKAEPAAEIISEQDDESKSDSPAEKKSDSSENSPSDNAVIAVFILVGSVLVIAAASAVLVVIMKKKRSAKK